MPVVSVIAPGLVTFSAFELPSVVVRFPSVAVTLIGADNCTALLRKECVVTFTLGAVSDSKPPESIRMPGDDEAVVVIVFPLAPGERLVVMLPGPMIASPCGTGLKGVKSVVPVAT